MHPKFSLTNSILLAALMLLPLIFLCCENKEQPAAEDAHIGPHHTHHRQFSQYDFKSESGWDSLYREIKPVKKKRGLEKPEGLKMFGWHMYAHGTQYKHYPWDLLWGVSYFGYMIDPSTGGYKNIYYWKTSDMIDSARAHNCKVFLTAGLYGHTDITAFLNNSRAQDTLAGKLVHLLQLRKADGVNIDFEGIPGNLSGSFSTFVERLKNALTKADPDYQLSLALYAIDREKVFDISALNAHVDFYTLMAYDYYGGFSSIAGPVAPFKSSETFGKWSMETSVDHYLNEGVKADELIVCMPLYGARWQTAGEEVPSKAIKFIRHFPLNRFQHDYIDSLQIKMSDYPTSENTYYAHASANEFEQSWIDDIDAVEKKIAFAKEKDLGGIGFWTLGYGAGSEDLWKMVGRAAGNDN